MIRSVRVTNWKGHEELRLSFGEGLNFLVGPNGIGKTSILDAICFALLGDIGATAIYKSIDYKNLIRDPERDMEITLTFCPQGRGEYTVRRTHSARTNRKSCTLVFNNTVLTRRWDEATAELLKLYNTSDLFLRRVILLSEGDTFAYSTQPPGEGLTKHIEDVLGINRMESLRSNLKRLKREFDTEAGDWKAEIKEVRESTEEDKKRAQQLTDQLEALREERDKFSENVDALNRQIGALASDIQRTEELITLANSVVQEWTQVFGEIPQNYEFLGALETLQQSLGKERSSLLTQRDSVRDELSWLAAQMDTQRRILELVEPLEREQEEIACPVCSRPLTTEMVRDIRAESLKVLEELEGRKKEKQTQLPTIETKIDEIEPRSRTLISIESKVRRILEQEPKTLSIPNLKSYLVELEGQRNARQEEVEKLKSQITEKDGQIQVREGESAELRNRIDEPARLEMMRSLTCATKGQYVSELFLNSTEAVLAMQRKTLLEPLTEELSAMWGAFLGVEVGVELKDNAQIMIVDRQGRSNLEFPQLSGGEKTALLIFTQMLLCKYFSNTDFMLLDEPLEHLDARNKWALIKFLVDTTKRGYPKQLIVTTIEETLLREYLDDAQIKINVLSREHPMIEGI